jgi:hypothetical protein
MRIVLTIASYRAIASLVVMEGGWVSPGTNSPVLISKWMLGRSGLPISLKDSSPEIPFTTLAASRIVFIFPENRLAIPLDFLLSSKDFSCLK